MMIASLSGILKEKSHGSVVIEAGGVGYGVVLPLSSYCTLPEKGRPVSLLVQTLFREDSLTLYGFATGDEKQMFNFLTSVTGIGPRLAINILSGISASGLSVAISGDDVEKICATPGVGKKTAQRIILELKEKIKRAGFVAEPVQSGDKPLSQASGDAESALITLGYRPDLAKSTVYEILKSSVEELTVEELIRESLRSLGR